MPVRIASPGVAHRGRHTNLLSPPREAIPPALSNKEASMRKSLMLVLTLAALIGVAPLLTACNTTAGAGKDISDAGHAITHAADNP